MNKEQFMEQLTNFNNLIGQRLYTLRIYQLKSSKNKQGVTMYNYLIAPTVLSVREIRIGKAETNAEQENYGPGLYTLLCQYGDHGYIRGFSPQNGELVSSMTLAGRQTRAFFNEDDLLKEAEILKQCVIDTYKHVNSVEIASFMPEQAKP